MPRRVGLFLIVFCVALNAAGFAFGLFELILFYDEVAHFVTPFTLVAIVTEIIYRGGGQDELFPTPGARPSPARRSASSAPGGGS